MKRATRNPSTVFRAVLERAEDQLQLDALAAADFQHRGIRGDERAQSLSAFLSTHLPSVFRVGKGEAIDYRDTRTGQLDLCIYDAASASPIQSLGENILVPAEGLFAVIEVKSVLSRAEIGKCVSAAKRVRSLKPFKREFSAPSTTGVAPSDVVRCPYIVFAYSTDLGDLDWAQKEYDRLKQCATHEQVPLDIVDRLLVLDRGLIRPQEAVVRMRDESEGIFLDFFIHLINFLMRERKRRPPIDWTAYSARGKWIRLQP